jgi:glutaredoxin
VESEEDGDSEVEEEISLGNEVEEILGDKDVEVESENGVTEVEDCEDGSGCPGGVCDVGDEEKVLDSFEGARDWMSDFIIPSETDSLQSTNSDSLSLPSNFYNNQDTAKMASGVSYNLYGKNVEDIELVTLVLGADWCPGCKNTKGMLETNEIPYFRVDVDQNKGLYNHYRDPTITSIPQTIFINRKTGNVEHRVTGELSRNMFNNAVNTARKNANF